MNRKRMTFFVVYNQTGETKKIVLSTVWVKAIGAIASVFVLLIVALIADYTGLIIQSSENKRLRVENEILRKQFEGVESRVESLEASLERVKTFVTKLRLITNIDTEDRNLKLMMGANDKTANATAELEQPMEQREPISSTEAIDSTYTQETPVNEQKGELVLKGSRDYGTLIVRIDGAINDSKLREQNILDLWEALAERQSLLNSTPNIKPARGWFTSRFGYRVSPFTLKATMHTGLDIAASPGTPIYAPADGIVSFVGYDDGYGKILSIDHGYGVLTRYAHNSQIYVQVGQRISRWDVIAAVGNTGRSTGPHLHYEVRVNGVPKDPSLYILDE